MADYTSDLIDIGIGGALPPSAPVDLWWWFAGPPVPPPDPRPRVTTSYLTVRAVTTMEARRLMARGQTDGTSLRAAFFSVGQGGFDPYNYLGVVPVNKVDDSLDDQVFVDVIDRIERPNDMATCFYCLLESGEANFALGEVGIWGEVQNSPGDPTDGTMIFMAVGHFPLIAKNSGMQYVLRVTIQA